MTSTTNTPNPEVVPPQPIFTAEQELRLREIIREEIEASHRADYGEDFFTSNTMGG